MDLFKKNFFVVDGKFYYGWICLIVAFMPAFVSLTIKGNCAPLFMESLEAELGITRTAYTQTNTLMTIAMMITSFFIGSIFRKYPTRWVLAISSLITTLCYVGMSRATSIWHLYVLSAIQGIGWAGNTSLSASIIVGNWFGPKIKGTALSLAMLGSGLGAMVWIKLVNNVISNSGWRTGYLVMAAINAIVIVFAFLLYTKPSDKGFTTRPGDPEPGEGGAVVSLESAGIPAKEAVKTARWWLQWSAAFLTMIGAAGFAFHCKAYLTQINGGDSAAAASLYAAALGTLIVGKLILGVLTDILKIKRTAVIAPLFYAGVFVALLLSANNYSTAKLIVPFYMIGGSIPTVIPFVINGRNFGNKEYSILQGWMIIAGNLGQIVGPTVAAAVYDTTGSYGAAWITFTALMLCVCVLYFLSLRASTKKIAELGYVAVD